MSDYDLGPQVADDVKRALAEDVGSGDLTAQLVPAERLATATIICREAAVICGRPWVDEVLPRSRPAPESTGWSTRVAAASRGRRSSRSPAPRASC